MLHLRPESVHMERAEPGNTAPLQQILTDLITGGIAAVSPNGVLGDPTRATADHGLEVLAPMLAEIHHRLPHTTIATTPSERPSNPHSPPAHPATPTHTPSPPP